MPKDESLGDGLELTRKINNVFNSENYTGKKKKEEKTSVSCTQLSIDFHKGRSTLPFELLAFYDKKVAVLRTYMYFYGREHVITVEGTYLLNFFF